MSFGFWAGAFSFILAFVLLGFALRERKQYALRLARLGDVPLLIKLVDKAAPERRFIKHLLAVAAFVCLCIAFMSPRYGSKTEVLPRRGLDVVFAIDVSSSMRARDVLPDRLERIKAEIGVFLPELGENRVGIVAFAGTAFVQCPLTTDMSAVDMFLRALDPKEAPQGGTALSDALIVTRNLFLAEVENDQEAQKAGRVLVLMSDGEDHEGGVQSAAVALKELNVKTIVLGIGDANGEPIPITDDLGRVVSYRLDKRKQTIMTRLNEALLQDLAKAAEGKYIASKTRNDLGLKDVQKTINTLEKREFESRVKRSEIDRARWPMVLAFFLFALSVLFPAHRDSMGKSARKTKEKA